MAEVFGTRQLNIGIMGDTQPCPIAQVAERFGQICERAQTVGLQVALEPMAMSWLRHLAQAEEVLSGRREASRQSA